MLIVPDSKFTVLLEVLNLQEFGLPNTKTVAVFREVIFKKSCFLSDIVQKGGVSSPNPKVLG